MTTLAFQRLHDAAKLPTRAHAEDIGLDLRSAESWTIPPRGRAWVDTGLAVSIPGNYAGLVWDRSGRAGAGLTTRAGCIDPGYSGPLKVLVVNESTEDIYIGVEDRVAQLLVVPIHRLEPTWVAELPASSRGADGFGSTDPKDGR